MPQTCQEPDGSEWLWKAARGQQSCPSKSGFLPSLRINSVSRLSSWSVVSSRHSWGVFSFFLGVFHVRLACQASITPHSSCYCAGGLFLLIVFAMSFQQHISCVDKLGQGFAARFCAPVHSRLKLAFPSREWGASVHLLRCIPTSVTRQRVGYRALSKISKHLL